MKASWVRLNGMSSQPSTPFLLDVLTSSLRFFFLLWGGMLLTTLSLYNRLRPPDFLWRWPSIARFFLGPWGRGLCLGLGLVMAIAALLEVWTLVDKLLVRFLSDSHKEQ